MWESLLKSFIPLFVAFDVLGVLPIYARFSGGLDEPGRKRVLRDSIITAFLVTVAFVFVGHRIMAYLGILIKDFLVAGGVILFILAAREILSEHEHQHVGKEDLFAVVPIGVPLLAGPAVLTTSLILFQTVGILWVLVSLVLNLVICGVAFKYSHHIARLVGRRWVAAISKVFMLLLASIAIMFIRRGLEGFRIP